MQAAWRDRAVFSLAFAVAYFRDSGSLRTALALPAPARHAPHLTYCACCVAFCLPGPLGHSAGIFLYHCIPVPLPLGSGRCTLRLGMLFWRLPARAGGSNCSGLYCRSFLRTLCRFLLCPAPIHLLRLQKGRSRPDRLRTCK